MQSNFSDNCIHGYNVEILNISDSETQLISNKPTAKNKLKELFRQFCLKLKELLRKVQKVLVLDYKKKKNGHKIFHLSTKLISASKRCDKNKKLCL